MGGGVSKHVIKSGRTPQDDAMSYKGKVGGLKLILGSDEKKSALLKYLESKNKGCLLTWYFDLDEYKRTKFDNLLSKALDLRNKYDISFQIGQRDPSAIEVWNSVNETLPRHSSASSKSVSVSINVQDNDKKIKIAQDFISSLFVKELDGFLNSNEYRILESTEHNTGRVSSKNNAQTSQQEAIPILTKELKEKYKNILIIHDSYANSKALSRTLEANGHRVRLANHGRVGVNIATNGNFGVILIDMCMRTMDPIEVTKDIKKWFNLATDKTFSSSRLIDNSGVSVSVSGHYDNRGSGKSTPPKPSKKTKRSSLMLYTKSNSNSSNNNTSASKIFLNHDAQTTSTATTTLPLLLGMLPEGHEHINKLPPSNSDTANNNNNNNLQGQCDYDNDGHPLLHKHHFHDVVYYDFNAAFASTAESPGIIMSVLQRKTSEMAIAAPISSKTDPGMSGRGSNNRVCFSIQDFYHKIQHLHQTLVAVGPGSASMTMQKQTSSAAVSNNTSLIND